ncbi:MAG: hypothetical protein H0V17_04005 [Deltaproteobacteria bacterium]|nr:hypothetical protein [Deltaproteobacteria bacterium]
MDRGVIATAEELFESRHYPSVVALVSDALEAEPDCIPMMLIRARAHIALRRDLDAQADLRDIIRLEPQCGLAYRLLGELAARRDENESAAIFFREAIRLQPDDREAADWLMIVDASIRPTKKLQAVAAVRFPRAQSPRIAPAPIAVPQPAPDYDDDPNETIEARPQRLGRGTYSPSEGDERPTKPFARGSKADGEQWKARAFPLPAPATLPQAPPQSTLTGRPPTLPPARPAPKLAPSPSRPMTRGPTPELPGFGDYLVTTGILTRERLRAAQAYQRSMRVQLSTAIVTLGLATPQRIEWAAVSHQSQLARSQ